jgi:hypothetical protein
MKTRIFSLSGCGIGDGSKDMNSSFFISKLCMEVETE